MTVAAPDAEKLLEIDEDVRRAWSEYSDRLRELHGDEYERAEHEGWAALQIELRRLERRRRGTIHTAIECLSVGGPLRRGHLLRAERDAAERLYGDQPAGLPPRLPKEPLHTDDILCR